MSPQLWNDCRPDLDDSTPQRRVPRLRILVDGYLRPNQQCKASQTQHHGLAGSASSHTTPALRSSRARWHSTPLRPRVPPMSRRSAGHSWFLLGNLVGEVVVFDASNSIARKQEQARVSTSYRANPETRTKSRLSRKKYIQIQNHIKPNPTFLLPLIHLLHHCRRHTIACHISFSIEKNHLSNSNT